MTRLAIGKRLRALREARGLGLNEASRLAGLNSAILSDLERQGRGAKRKRRLGRYAGRLALALGDQVLRLVRTDQMALSLRWGGARRVGALDGREVSAFLARMAQVPVEVPPTCEVWSLSSGHVVLAPVVGA